MKRKTYNVASRMTEMWHWMTNDSITCTGIPESLSKVTNNQHKRGYRQYHSTACTFITGCCEWAECGIAEYYIILLLCVNSTGHEHRVVNNEHLNKKVYQQLNSQVLAMTECVRSLKVQKDAMILLLKLLQATLARSTQPCRGLWQTVPWQTINIIHQIQVH